MDDTIFYNIKEFFIQKLEESLPRIFTKKCIRKTVEDLNIPIETIINLYFIFKTGYNPETRDYFLNTVEKVVENLEKLPCQDSQKVITDMLNYLMEGSEITCINKDVLMSEILYLENLAKQVGIYKPLSHIFKNSRDSVKEMFSIRVNTNINYDKILYPLSITYSGKNMFDIISSINQDLSGSDFYIKGAIIDKLNIRLVHEFSKPNEFYKRATPSQILHNSKYSFWIHCKNLSEKQEIIDTLQNLGKTIAFL